MTMESVSMYKAHIIDKEGNQKLNLELSYKYIPIIYISNRGEALYYSDDGDLMISTESGNSKLLNGEIYVNYNTPLSEAIGALVKGNKIIEFDDGVNWIILNQLNKYCKY